MGSSDYSRVTESIPAATNRVTSRVVVGSRVLVARAVKHEPRCNHCVPAARGVGPISPPTSHSTGKMMPTKNRT